MSLRTGFSLKVLGTIFRHLHSSRNRRSRRLVVRIARRFGDSDLAHLSVVLNSLDNRVASLTSPSLAEA